MASTEPPFLPRADTTRLGLSEVLADVFPHLVMPVGPVVAAFRAPVVEMMSDPACYNPVAASAYHGAWLGTAATSR